MSGTTSDTITGIYRVLTGYGTGTGFRLKDEPYVVTNYHVVAGFREVALEDSNRNRLKGRLAYIDPGLDLALIATDNQDGSTLEALAHDSISQGSSIQIWGFPLGMPLSLTQGIVSSENQLVGNTRYIQTDAAINPGNSGGPMLDEAGRVVGITTCKLVNAENMGFALPIVQAVESMTTFKQLSAGNSFGVKCPSCSNLLVQAAPFCNNCGAELKIEQYFQDAKKNALTSFVEGALEKAKIDPILARCGFNFWEFHVGSALSRIFVYRDDFLFATCPLVELPSDNLGDFYRFLLKNRKENYVLGIQHNTVYLSYRVHLSDVFSKAASADLFERLAYFPELADKIDNALIDRFSCKPSTETRMPDPANPPEFK